LVELPVKKAFLKHNLGRPSQKNRPPKTAAFNQKYAGVTKEKINSQVIASTYNCLAVGISQN
jgi:hypothetical protein